MLIFVVFLNYKDCTSNSRNEHSHKNPISLQIASIANSQKTGVLDKQIHMEW